MFWEAVLKLGEDYLKEKRRMADAVVDMANAMTALTGAVTSAVGEFSKLSGIIAAGLPSNGGGGIPTDTAEQVVTAMNTLTDGLTKAVTDAEAAIAPPNPPVV